MATSISPALKTSARSAYRALFRASGSTFAGDDRVLHAFRDKVRTETAAGRQELDPAEYEARVQHAFEVATVLKKNIVQGTRESNGSEEGTWRLRMTPDTELGSNEGVKTPYVRPTRGIPRSKCGEDPNATAPLPPKSLRGSMSAAGSTRSRAYSTHAAQEQERQREDEDEFEEYDKTRVQSLVAKLSQVNRRVTASPTGLGKEPIAERVLLEDKLDALAARIDFLALEMHAQIHQSTSAPPPKSLANILLDVLPINPEEMSRLSSSSSMAPPVHMRQFVRYLQAAGKATTAARTAALSLPPSLRTAIADEMESAAYTARPPTTPAEHVRALIWRMLMVKRGVSRVVQASGADVGMMAGAVRRAVSFLNYAQECLEVEEKEREKLGWEGGKEGDGEKVASGVEDVRVLVDEIEKVWEWSILGEVRKEGEARLAAGNAWDLVDTERQKYCAGGDGIWARLRLTYARLRKLETKLSSPPPLDDPTHMSWRRALLARNRLALAGASQYLLDLTTALDALAAHHNRLHDSSKTGPLVDAQSALTPSKLLHLQETIAKRNKVRLLTPAVWADLLGHMCDEMKIVEGQLRTVEGRLRAYKGMAIEELDGKELGAAMVYVKVKLILAYDVVWRIAKRIGKDAADMRDLVRSARTSFEEPRPRLRPFGIPAEGAARPPRTPRRIITRRETEDLQIPTRRESFSETEILDFVMSGTPLRGRFKEGRR